MSTSLIKTLGALVLVGTLGVASCQALVASHDDIREHPPAPVSSGPER